MTLQLRSAVYDGFSLALSRNGLLFMAAFVFAEMFSLLVFLGGGLQYVPLEVGSPFAPGGEGPAGELPEGASSISTFLAGLFGSLVTIPIALIAIRTFVAGRTDRVPDDLIFRRLGRATLSAILAGFLVWILVFLVLGGFIGLLIVGALMLPSGTPVRILLLAGGVLVLLSLPILWLHFLFIHHEIGVRDVGVFASIRDSWVTVSQSRLRLFLLATILIVLQFGVSAAGLPSFDAPAALTIVQGGLMALTLIGSGIIGVFSTAILARAYRQLSPDPAVRADSSHR